MNETPPPDTVFAGSGNRAVAFVLDLIVLALLAAVFAGLPAPAGVLIAPLAFIYLAGMPLSPFQGTLGKWVCRIRLCDREGRPLGWRASALRAGGMVGWFALPALLSQFARTAADWWWLVFLLPWVSIGFLPRRESLFDLAAQSLVVRTKAEAGAIAGAAASPVRVFGGLGTLLLCLGIGAAFSTMLSVYQVRMLHGRIAYAVNETRPLRACIEDFRAEKGRWPGAAELGLAAAVPYPDGGSYRVADHGRIVITFSVLPELKGRSLVFTPTPDAKSGELTWTCVADTGLDKAYVPAVCR